MTKNIKEQWRQFAAWVDGIENDEPVVTPEEKCAARPHLPDFVHRVLSEKNELRLYHAFSVVMCLVFTGTLLLTVLFLPTFGGAGNPTENEVMQRYVEKGIEEVGATNLISNIILVYRGFDTFGESCVLFLAATCVMILLRKDEKNTTAYDLAERAEDAEIESEENATVLRSVVRLLMPVILLFGVYVLLNGHLSPGGGFSGGAILGAGLILFENAFGLEKVRRFMSEHVYHIIKVAALYFYGFTMIYVFFTGANDLHSIIGTGIPGMIFSAGVIMPINVAVGLEVACTMYAFYAFFSKGEL